MRANPERAWEIHEGGDGWYYFDGSGEPYGPFTSEEFAMDALSGHSDEYYRAWEEDFDED